MALKEVGQKGVVASGTNGEVWLTSCTGFPDVTIQKKNSDVSHLSIDIPGLDYPFSGYFPTNSSMGNVLSKFSENKMLLTVLFEQKRKKDIDRNIPINELRPTPEIAKANTVKIVAGIYDWKENKWILSDESTVTEVPQDWTNELIKRSLENDFNEDSFVPIVEAPKPVVTVETDKSFFLINYYMFVKDMETKFEYELSDERRRLIARKLLILADAIQQKTTGIPIPNYKDYSHTRARGLVFQVFERFVNLDKRVETDEGLNNIMKSGMEMVTSLLNWSE